MHWWTGTQTFILCSLANSPSNTLTFTHTSWHQHFQTFCYQFLHKCTHTCTSARSLTHTYTAWNTWVYPRHKNSCSPHDTDANVPTCKFSSVHFWSVATCQQPNTLHPTLRCQSAAPSSLDYRMMILTSRPLTMINRWCFAPINEMKRWMNCFSSAHGLNSQRPMKTCSNVSECSFIVEDTRIKIQGWGKKQWRND